MTDAEPRMLSDRYEVGPIIGRGGMGDVCRARDLRLGRDVAIKFLRPDLAAQTMVRERFEQEARAAARLSHPNVVTVFDTDEDHGEPYIVMECLPGRTVADELQQGPFAVERVRRLAREVLGALSAAHHLGIVHRDIKPSNLLIGVDDRFKVADFGIAKSADAIDHTSTGEILGTAAYLPPERLEGRPATPQSDLYSLGVVLYQTLTGAKPFEADTPVGVVYKIRSTDPTPLRELRPDADCALMQAIERALSKDPDARYGSADEMAAALAPAPAVDTPTRVIGGPAGDKTATLATATGVLLRSPRPPEPLAQRRPALNARLIGAAVAVVAVLAVLLLINQSSSGPAATVPVTATTAPGSPTAGSSLSPALNTAIDKLDQAVQS